MVKHLKQEEEEFVRFAFVLGKEFYYSAKKKENSSMETTYDSRA